MSQSSGSTWTANQVEICQISSIFETVSSMSSSCNMSSLKFHVEVVLIETHFIGHFCNLANSLFLIEIKQKLVCTCTNPVAIQSVVHLYGTEVHYKIRKDLAF